RHYSGTGRPMSQLRKGMNSMLSIIFSLNTLWWLILLLYIPACFALIIIVLLQKGKGQGLAGAFGMGGGMDTIFGPRSSKSLPQKITYAGAAVFMVLALVMSILSGKVGKAAAPELAEAPVQASLDALFDGSAAEAPADASEAAGGITEVTVNPDTPAEGAVAAPTETAEEAAAAEAPAEAAVEEAGDKEEAGGGQAE
ncbi:MAG TPA: preprotein translocase subunit SecG, partial [Candidatus Hydrogenedentes bacterium]|nr:preprotein translocase subunit SecG [Candidatus Hydrogenedentota bacterium]